MPRTIYNDGNYVAEHEAFIPLMDRSFLFGDGIYEVSAVLGGRLVDNDAHLARLERSLNEIDIPNPHQPESWVAIQHELIARNGLDEGVVYTQVSRGVWEREFTSPPDLKPRVVMFTQAKALKKSKLGTDGAAVICVPDLRWARRDIKSTSLLAQVLAKRAARAAGVDEAWMIDEGCVTEGASSTAFIITHAGEIVSRPLSHAILAGITRGAVLELAAEQSLHVSERVFTLAEALAAREAFYTSAGSFVTPVIRIDGTLIGEGRPGPLVRRLRELYIERAGR